MLKLRDKFRQLTPRSRELENLLTPRLTLTVRSFDRTTVLAHGAYSTIFEGHWREIPVAVKQVPNSNSTNEREETTLLKLNHRNVIKLFHIDSDEHFKFYVLELCKASLDQLFLKNDDPRKYRGPMPADTEVLHQLAEGLEYIHQMKLIHRDIKPEKVLIWLTPVFKKVLMKWSGFGLNKRVNERGSHSISGVRGTHNWLAPEILKSLQEDEDNETEAQQRGTIQSDVFAEGLVFGYYLLGGAHLFGSRYQIQYNIIENAPVNLPKIKDGTVRALIEKMLTANPEDRMTSSDVVQQLEKILEEETDSESDCPQAFFNNSKPMAGGKNKLSKVRQQKQKEGEEFSIMPTSDHPNVVKKIELHLTSKRNEPSYVSLDQLFMKNGPHSKYLESMPPAQDVLYQLAIGLYYIHETGLIHLDIKPQNALIWMNPTANKVVMKWGNSALNTTTKSSTKKWSAPELLKLKTLHNGDSDALSFVKSDVFAQGLVFGYYLLSGKHVFGSRTQIVINIMANKPVNLQKIRNQAIRDLIKRMLEPNPEKRMTSSDVAKELEQIRAEDRPHRFVLSSASGADDKTSKLKQIKVNVNKILGSGGYGTVYQGEWNNIQVAVKQIPLSKVESNRREEEALQMLNHPNVIKLFYAESDSENRYYAIELCVASLDELFLNEKEPKKYRGPMPPDTKVFLQLADGLQYIHEKGLIHRDIKPPNVLIHVDSTGENVLLKWADFGLSKLVNENGSFSLSKNVKGSDKWFPPEILKLMDDEEANLTESQAKQRGTVKSDVFNQGLVFGYYLLKGRHLFGNLTESNIYRDKPVNLDKIQWEIGRQLIKKMIHPDPEKRISSSDVAKELLKPH